MWLCNSSWCAGLHQGRGKNKEYTNLSCPALKLVYLSTWDELSLLCVQLEAEGLHGIPSRALEQSVFNWNTLLGHLTMQVNKTKLHVLECGKGEDGFALEMEYKKKKVCCRIRFNYIWVLMNTVSPRKFSRKTGVQCHIYLFYCCVQCWVNDTLNCVLSIENHRII